MDVIRRVVFVAALADAAPLCNLGVLVSVYNNTALAGTPLSTTTVTGLAAAFGYLPAGTPFSAELTATLRAANRSLEYSLRAIFWT